MPAISLKEFIATHLSQNCVKMTEHLHNSIHLAEISNYLAKENDYRPEEILTLRIKLFEYYSCMRMFDVCHHILAEISNKNKGTEFNADLPYENIQVAAEYYMLVGIQYRNYLPIQNFELSRANFNASLDLYSSLIFGSQTLQKQVPQEFIDERFRVNMNLLVLYVNYWFKPDEAARLIHEMNDLLNTTPIRENAYVSIFHFASGCYYLKTNDTKNAIDSLNLAIKFLDATPEKAWALNGEYRKLIDSKLEEAKKARLPNLFNPVPVPAVDRMSIASLLNR